MTDLSTRISPPQQEQIEMLQRELANAQRMAALGELTGTTTHEFNNVLMTIINYAKIGLRNRDDATRDKSLDKILSAAQRAERIVNSVLGMARNRSQEFAPTDLASLVDESLVLLEREMQKYRVQVIKEFNTAPQVRAIGNQIQQVLLNLMTNARQAMPRGGVLTLSIAHAVEEGLVDLTVRDTGEGISRDRLPRIFDRYFTTKQGPDATGKGGLGVGLSTCRDIVQAHDGRLRVESAVGRGTAFTVRLPIWSAPQYTGPQITPLGVPAAK